MQIVPTRADAFRLFMEGSQALSIVEMNGIRIDTDYLRKTIDDTAIKIKVLEAELREDEVFGTWRKTYGNGANLGSRDQLGKILFGKLKLPYSSGLTRTERYRTDDEVLAGLKHPFVRKYLRTEKLKKLKSTYLEGVLGEVVDGYLHPSFNEHTVSSYRLSSNSPNFQNVPIRDPEQGTAIRRAFVPRGEDRVLVEVDYSAIEFKGCAVIWRDPNMLEYAFDPKKDIHSDLARECYLLEKDEWNKDSRYCGKNGFVFPRLYGSYYVQIASNMWNMIREKKLKVGKNGDGVSLKKHLRRKGITELGDCTPKYDPRPGTFEYHIREVEKRWDSRFSGLNAAQERHIAQYKQRGYFDMVTGFRCGGVYSKNQLLNLPIQGPCAHCLLLSLILLQKWLRKYKMKSLIVGTIHDCCVLDCLISELQDVLHALKRIMTVELPKRWPWIIVPLSVEVDVTDPGGSPEGNWHHKRPWVEKGGTWIARNGM